MIRAHRFAALPLALAGVLMVLAAGPAPAQGRDAAMGVAADLAVPDHADAIRMAAKDDRGHRGRDDRGRHGRDDRAYRRDDHRDWHRDRRDDRREWRDDRRDWRADRRDWERDRREWERDRHEFRHERREAYRDGYRDGRRHYRNRWGYRPGYYVPRERYVVVREYHRYGYAPPPWGHAYVSVDGDVFLVALATGLIVSAIAY
ncbi:RcnB family protein [Limibaculum sp. FT325]|uniref:RcnB family protein n=1 Tax=Thermohalobaculum sediminis TaxID=2939436 RepID=UPI0020BF0A8B|nr:RcnB family protein [Limibaculum sediminis]MCL5777644.1 RcnB family protein [Limibaculum sediminis]